MIIKKLPLDRDKDRLKPDELRRGEDKNRSGSKNSDNDTNKDTKQTSEK